MNAPSPEQAVPAAAPTAAGRPRPYWAALVVLACLAAVAGVTLYRGQADLERRRVLTDLDNIGQLKIRQATQWRDDRLADAGMFGRGPLLWEALGEHAPRLSDRADAGVVSYLTELVRQYGYARCALVDPAGRVVASVSGEGRQVDTDLAGPLAQAFAAGRPIMSDLVWSAGSPDAYLQLVAPIYRYATAGNPPLGAIVLWSDADALLHNAVDWWPTASRTAESLLVRRDGDAVLYLNLPRATGDTAPRLHVPLAMKDVPAVKAVLGQRGRVDGVDCDGTRVLATIHEVPGTPWLLITQVDESEAMAPWRRRGTLLVGLVALFVVALLGAAAGVQQIQARYVSLARATDQLRASQALVAERTEALEGSEERFRRLFADSTDPILLIEGGVFVDGNAAALASLGLGDVADLRDTPPHLLSPDRQPDGEVSQTKSVRMIATAIEQGSHTFEWVHCRPDGALFWVEVVLTAISLRDRSLVYCMWRDITERKRAEASIRDALLLNERLLAAATVGIVVYERGGACPLANQAAADALGMPLTQLLATPMAEVPVWQAAGAVAAAQRALGSGATQQFDARFEAAGGWRSDLECSISVFERHEVPHLLFVVADVTERHLAEARRRQLSAIVEATSDFVGTATPDGRVTYLNSTARELLGLSADDDLSTCSVVAAQPEWAARRVLGEGFAAALRGETWSARTAFINATGVEVPHSQVLIGHRGPSGEIEVISTVARDISAPVRAEQMTEARLRLMAAAAGCVDTDAFLQTALDEIEAATGSSIGFYHFVEPDGEHLRLQAWSTNTVAHMCSAEGKGSHYRLGEAGVWADCARVGQPIVHNDYAQLTERRGLPAGHAPIIREVTVPVLRGGRAVAIIGVGNRAVPYDDAAVEVVQLLGDFSYEVVERLRAEQARAEGEERLRLVMSRVPCILSTALVTARGEWRGNALDPTPEGCPFDWSEVRVLNLDSAQVLLPLAVDEDRPYYRAWRLSRHPDDQRQANLNAGRAFLDGASQFSNVWRCTDRHGVEHWQHQEVTIEPVDDHSWRVFGVATDITDQRQAELARVAGEALLREVTGGVPCILTTAILEADPDWRQQVQDRTLTDDTFRGSDQQVLNLEAAQGLLPLDPQPGESYYDAWRRCRNTEDQERAGSAMLSALIHNQNPYVVEWRCTDRNGVAHWQRQEITMQPVGEARWRAFAMTIDITELKRAETEQHELMAELQRSNSELEQFAYVASHDLQEPLRLVNAYTELLLQRYRDRLDEGAEPLVNFITDGVSRMQRLVQDLLLYSRVSSRNAPMVPTSMAGPLANALENLTLAIAESGAEITADDLPAVPCDPLQMTQLFQNLVGNGIKFRRPDDVPRIHISARRAEDGTAWRFEVTDNGIGIEPEYHERIFVIFQRLHTRRQYAGTGIGLAICKRIVERHGGLIGVESPPGAGTTFWFTLPIRGLLSDNGEGQDHLGSEGDRDTPG